MKISLKEVGIFAVSFLLTIVIIGLLFGGIISRIPTETLNNLPSQISNQASPVLLLIWVAVILPSLVAYWAAFKLYKRKIDETEITTTRKYRIIFTIIATPILVAAVVFSIKVLSPPVFAPYTLHSVSESELRPPPPTPTPPSFGTILTKTDNADVTYKIISKDDALWLYREEDKVWLQPLPLKKQFLRDFWYDSNSNQLFAVEALETKDETQSGEGNEQIAAYSIQNGQIETKQTLVHNPGLYSSTRILAFYPSFEKLLLTTSGGDGCGSWGEVWILNEDGTRQEVQEYAGGCLKPELPRFLGFNETVLIFVTYKPLAPEEYFDIWERGGNIIAGIFTIDPLTLEKKIAVD